MGSELRLVAEMSIADLETEHWFWKNWLFGLRYSSTMRMVGGELRVVPHELGDDERVWEARDHEVVQELLARRRRN